jgi:hydroxypyruvate isomerase
MNNRVRFSANLGFLWTNLTLPNAIRAAALAGFDAVECHLPYGYKASEIKEVLVETGLPMISLNTRIGVHGLEDLGVAAKPGREQEAREYIEEAIAYAADIDCANISVVAGRTGKTTLAELVYRKNLAYAAKQAKFQGKTILIEPLNTNIAMDYHLTYVEDGISTIKAVGADNLKLMIDCFHTYTMQGDLVEVFQKCIDYVGHIQISSYPDRGEPVDGEIDYQSLIRRVQQLGYGGAFGAEYTPRANIDEGLSWLQPWRKHK